ncbi:MAG: XdhC family protein [Anaerolineae bacterium]|nr:XdhC family protein [Anaerolineae bacterium]
MTVHPMSDPILTALTQSITRKRPVALATVVAATGLWAAQVGRKAVVWLDQEPLGLGNAHEYGSLGLGDLDARALADAHDALAHKHHRLLRYEIEGEQVEVFVEVQRRPPTLIIVGAGHIAVPLAQLGGLCAFSVTVLDDRAQFATRERFPTADQVIAAPFRKTMREMPIDNDTYVVLVTRGHQHDIDCLLEVIDGPAAYIGMIGSKRRVRAVFELLEREQGMNPAKFDRVYSPIGLDIGAETPAEIAVCIMAEIIKVFRGNAGTARSISDERREKARRRSA